MTLMWAPIRLIIPVGEITAEYRVMPKLGVSIELGGGKRTLTSGTTDVKGTELEGGAQVRYYVLGDFHKGVELGGEILDEHVKFDEPLPANVMGAAAGGITAGPFVGYKVATPRGFHVRGAGRRALPPRRSTRHRPGLADDQLALGAAPAPQHRLVDLENQARVAELVARQALRAASSIARDEPLARRERLQQIEVALARHVQPADQTVDDAQRIRGIEPQRRDALQPAVHARRDRERRTPRARARRSCRSRSRGRRAPSSRRSARRCARGIS